MKYAFIILMTVLGISILFYGCSDEEGEDTPPTPPTITAPEAITIAYDDSIKFVWENCPQSTESDFQGYYIYVSKTDLNGLAEDELENYRIDDIPKLDTSYLLVEYDACSLEINAIYYFGIRSVRNLGDRDTISPLEIVQTSLVIIGEGRIYEYVSDSVCAFNFLEGVGITSDETSPDPDFYLDTCTTCDISGYAVKSPHLSNSPWTGQCGFKLLGTGDPNVYSETDDSGMMDYYEISMQVYGIKTSTNHFVKMWVTGFGGEYPNKYIGLKYKYQTKTDYPHF